jgi:hypothetical protein
MIERFLQLLSAATAAIQQHYFQLPVAGQEDPIYRERVYCYELYHQLRELLEGDPLFDRYALCGEVDKSGHPIIRRHVPDFVLHVPKTMDSNLVVIEVKPINAELSGFRKDLETLAYFTSDAVGYQCGIELVYGDGALENFMGEFPKDNPKLRLLWHKSPGTKAFMGEL